MFNNDRVKNGLDHCANTLERLSDKDRKLSQLDSTAIFSFLEAMSSSSFSQKEALLAKHFDKPFLLVRGPKRLRPEFFLPAFTSFLFSPNEPRRQWAEFYIRRLTRASISDMSPAFPVHISSAEVCVTLCHFLPVFFLPSPLWCCGHCRTTVPSLALAD